MRGNKSASLSFLYILFVTLLASCASMVAQIISPRDKEFFLETAQKAESIFKIDNSSSRNGSQEQRTRTSQYTVDEMERELQKLINPAFSNLVGELPFTVPDSHRNVFINFLGTGLHQIISA